MRIRTVSALLTLLASLSLWPAGPAVADTAADGRVAYENSAQGDTDIHVVNADGTGDVNVTPGTPTSQELDPAWSPDGARIAFISDRVTDTNPDGNLELFVMNADGTDVMQLTVTEAALGGFVQTYAPTWSPDGGTIAFSGYRQWGSSEIFTIPSAGGAEIKLTDPGDWANKWEPDWSSDGSTIVFTWGWDAYSQELRDMAPDGTAVRTLFDGDPWTAQRNPAFSPDGTRIAFRSDHEDANGDIYVMNADGTGIVRVTDNPAIDEAPTWSVNGSEIIFSSTRAGAYDLYAISAPPAVASARVSARTAAPAAEGEVRALGSWPGDQLDPDVAAGGAPPPPPDPNACTQTGTAGADKLYGTPGRDVLCGLGGADVLYGYGGNDLLIGGAGADLMYGGAGPDELRGGKGNDDLFGGKGADILMGGGGMDDLYGGGGIDTCAQGPGSGARTSCEA